jgi:bacteriocin biosynthesis cyclodehydratase domain-containing protein
LRPVLAPASRRLWRDHNTLQLGRPSSRATVLEGFDDTRRRLLPLLDGTRSREQVLQAAREAGCADAEAVLVLLEHAGLLLDVDDLHPGELTRAERDRLAPDIASLALVRGRGTAVALRARRAARVVVHGAGRVGAPLAALLSSAGVGTVDVHDHQPTRASDTAVRGLTEADLGRPRAEAVAASLRSLSSVRPPSLAVLTDDRADETAPVLGAGGTPHLLARVDEHVGTVGPLVLPGRSACLHCLDLVRAELDPGWPALAAQLDQPSRTAVACDGVLAVAVASQAALQVLQLLEGDLPASVGGTLELELPDWRWRRRTWPQHPGCPCAWALDPLVSATG